MMDGKGRSGASDRSPVAGADTPPVRYVRDRLRETEKVIKTLKTDLVYYRLQNTQIVKERNDLLRLLSQKEALGDKQSRLEGDFRLVRSERDRLGEELSRIREEHKELQDRCSWLEAALADEHEKCSETLEVVVCLEAQIEQLESMVEMLLEHMRLKATGNG